MCLRALKFSSSASCTLNTNLLILMNPCWFLLESQFDWYFVKQCGSYCGIKQLDMYNQRLIQTDTILKIYSHSHNHAPVLQQYTGAILRLLLCISILTCSYVSGQLVPIIWFDFQLIVGHNF